MTGNPASPCPGIVRQAIQATAASSRACRDQVRREPALWQFYQFILSTFGSTGQPPDARTLTATATALRLDSGAVLARLAELDLIVVGRADEPPIRVAYPFSAAPTRHHVALAGGPPVHAVCAIDALSIPLMLRRDAVITSAEPETGHPIRITIRGSDAGWHPDTAVVFLTAPSGSGPAADCACCQAMNFFTSRLAAAEWLADHDGVTGWILTQAQALSRARLVFADLLFD